MTADQYRIEYLADRSDCIDACAAWTYGRWGIQVAGKTLSYAQKRYEQGAQKNALPLTMVVINNDTDLPVAMGSLWEQDGEEWQDISPWIATVFVHYLHRKKGLATQLISQLEQEAKRLGFENTYLKTGSAAPLYKKSNYEHVETLNSETTSAGELILYKKALL